jgi:hypothetical protein
MKKIFWLVIVIVAFLFWKNSFHQESVASKPKLVPAPTAIGTNEDPLKRFNYENRQLIDPATGKIPINIHRKEAEFVKRIPTVENLQSKPGFRTKSETWTLAGPSNVGGRTRALALDVTDEKIIIAGGVSGGMWRSENSGLAWTRSSHPTVINSSTCVVQDIRPGKENIWYHGTGELRGNSARSENAPYRGDGIFKSTDGAKNWDILPSTSDGLESQFNSPFNYIWNMALDHTNLEQDIVYAAVYGGILKSTDGGNTWETTLGANLLNVTSGTDFNQFGVSFYTNIMITPSGTLYATLSVFTSQGNQLRSKGVFKSIDGISWENITPVGFAQFHERTVMSYAPSNENTIYFAVDNDDLDIWKYNDSNKSWTDLSQNVPDFEGDLADYDSQDGYNMMIAVHPEDENIVFIGGTNLYRTTDGFKSMENNSWIGGYNTDGTSNLYEGHHPDQHAVVFYPSNADKMISGNDGGLMITNNNSATDPSWNSLNNGYVTSQFYSISISRDPNSNAMSGGMQDNGTYLKTAPGANQPWNDIFGGDGGYTASTPADLFWYASFQEAQIYRLTLDEQAGLTSFARVDPVGGEDYLFINPYVLDPNNYNRMYLAGGLDIWRNNNLSQVTGGSQEPTTINWDKIEIEGLTTNITALDISTSPANTLYFGTGLGKVLKMENANSGQGEISSIFDSEGYVVNISIDPSNTDNVLVLNSNYNIPSIYYTDDGGQTFVDVGGNLEEFPDGSGNGPSIRWSEIVPLENGAYKYFIGTSSGLYSSTKLDGQNTVWLKEGNEGIGRSVVRMMDYRDSDGRFVVATHGNGVFESTVPNTRLIEKSAAKVESLVVSNSYPNPFSEYINIEFEIPEQGPLSVIVLNASGQNIKTILNFPQFAGNVNVRWDGTNALDNPVPDGIYFYRIFYAGKVTGGRMIYNRP